MEQGHVIKLSHMVFRVSCIVILIVHRLEVVRQGILQHSNGKGLWLALFLRLFGTYEGNVLVMPYHDSSSISGISSLFVFSFVSALLLSRAPLPMLFLAAFLYAPLAKLFLPLPPSIGV